MISLFVDTWAWVALADNRDPWHASAMAVHNQLRASHKYLTTDYVLSEVITLLYRRCPFKPASQFLSVVFEGCRTGIYRQVTVGQNQFQQAWELRQRFNDKPQISFVDFTSMVVMQGEGVREIFTGDDHFLQVNMGFSLFPMK